MLSLKNSFLRINFSIVKASISKIELTSELSSRLILVIGMSRKSLNRERWSRIVLVV